MFLLFWPVQAALVALGSRRADALPALFWRAVIAAIGVRIRTVGRPAAGRPLLLCANHVSWLDIGVLSACLPVAFVARADLARWPLIGHFAWLQGAIFVDRTRRAATVATSRAMAARLRTGRAVVLFPEGTSTDGARVAPFRASLLAAARDAADGSASPASAQPVAIAYVGRRGVPMGRRERPTYAWYGDMELAPHVPKVLASGVVEVTVAFGAPVEVGPGTDRKRLAASLEREVRTMLHEALTGRRGNVAPGG